MAKTTFIDRKLSLYAQRYPSWRPGSSPREPLATSANTRLVPTRRSGQPGALYGSAAQARDTAASDFDLLVVSDTLTLETLRRALAPTVAMLGRHAGTDRRPDHAWTRQLPNPSANHLKLRRLRPMSRLPISATSSKGGRYGLLTGSKEQLQVGDESVLRPRHFLQGF